MWIDVCPVPKPRQSRSDVWKKRPAVMRYRQFADDLRHACKEANFVPSDQLVIEFHMPMPKSWSKKKKLEMIGRYHTVKPDLDNMIKSCLDALFSKSDRDDACVHSIAAKKVWSIVGKMNLMNKWG